jgi:hypothetical protein
VKLVKERGVAARQAATDLGLHENVLRKCVKNVEAHREQAHRERRRAFGGRRGAGDGALASSTEPVLSQAADAYCQVVTSLRKSLDADDIAAARPLLRQLIGPITVVATTQDGESFLTANFPGVAANSASTAGEGRLVAGASYGLYTRRSR